MDYDADTCFLVQNSLQRQNVKSFFRNFREGFLNLCLKDPQPPSLH